MHLVLAAFAERTKRIEIPPPAMIKPYRLWSGKQVILVDFVVVFFRY